MAYNSTASVTMDSGCFDSSQYHQFNSASDSTTKLRFSPVVTIVIYVIYLLPFCFGVFGNISVCLIFFQQKKLRSITNTFLMNLCLNDLIVLCVSIPMTLSAALLEHWVFGGFLCKFVNYMPTLTALVSTFTVAVIAVERWSFIVNKRKFDRRCTIVTLILLWLVSSLIALPEFISRTRQEFPASPIPSNMKMIYSPHSSKFNRTDFIPSYYSQMMIKPPCQMKKIYYCVLTPGLRMRIFSYLVITVQYLVPFLFVSISCYSISRYLKRRIKRMHAYQTARPMSKIGLARTASYRGSSQKSSHVREEKFLTRSPPTMSKCCNTNQDEVTEQELTSHDDVPVVVIANINLEKDSRHSFLSHIRQTFISRSHLPTNLHYHNTHIENPESEQYFLPSSSIDTVLMPVKRCQSHTKRRFHKSRKLLICVAALFTISWLPLTIVQIYLEHNEEIQRTRHGANFIYGFLLIPCYLISSLSAWLNPVIYNYINRSFRREFYSLYSCCFKSTATTESPVTGHKRQQQQQQQQPEQSIVVINANKSASLSRLPSEKGTRVVTFAENTKKPQTITVIDE